MVRVGVVHGGEGIKQRIAALVGAPQPLNLGAQVVLGLPPGVVEDALQAGLLAPFAGILAIALRWSEVVSMCSSHGYNSGRVGHGHPDGANGERAARRRLRRGVAETGARKNASPPEGEDRGHIPGIDTHSPWPVSSCSAGRPFEPGVVGACCFCLTPSSGTGQLRNGKRRSFTSMRWRSGRVKRVIVCCVLT